MSHVLILPSLIPVLVSSSSIPSSDDLAVLEGKVATLRAELEKVQQRDRQAELGTELGTALRELARECRWRSRPRKGQQVGTTQKEEMRKRSVQSLQAFRDAVRVFEDVAKNHPESTMAPHALYWLVDMYALSDPRKSVEMCGALLERYPDARLPMLVGGKIQFGIYRKLGEGHARLGERDEAVGAYVASLRSAESEIQRKSGVMKLLVFEPRVARADYRGGLPEDVVEDLEWAKPRASVTIVLRTSNETVRKKASLSVEYQVLSRTVKSHRRTFCLAFFAIPVSRPQLQNSAADRSKSNETFLGHTGPLDLTGATGVFVSRRLLVDPGCYQVFCRLEDHTKYTPAAVGLHGFPGMWWTEPKEFTVVHAASGR